jgi:hypothetical protein
MKHTFKTSFTRMIMLVFWFLQGSSTQTLPTPTPKSHNQLQNHTHEITIFVHGIMGSKLALSFYHIVTLLKDKSADTVYAKTIDGIRTNPFFYQNQPIAHPGLQKLEVENLAPGNAAGIAAYLYDALDAMENDVKTHYRHQTVDQDLKGKINQTRHHYYTYGWSGLLSKQARQTEGEEFLAALERLWNDLCTRSITPKLRLIGFSHGGNICIQLAHAKQKLQKETPVTIDELVLIGTPIIDETNLALSDPLFENIYNLYSPADSVQKMEVFSGNFFSGQKFEATHDAPLPSKLTQIEVRVQKDRIKKNRYTKKERNFGAIDYSPGHMELWFFGWTPNHYREDFPLYPLPTIVFAPTIINRVKTASSNDQKNIVVTLHPESNTMSIGSANMPFLSPTLLNTLKETALEYAPSEYSLAQYREHCKEAYWAARDQKDPFKKK